VFAEIYIGHFGLPAALLDQIIIGHDQARAENPQDFSFLDFMRVV
jgi:hypothetical protein